MGDRTLDILSRKASGDAISGDLHLGHHVGRDDFGILELLVEMARQQQHGVLQLALAVGDRALAEFADHHDGAER